MFSSAYIDHVESFEPAETVSCDPEVDTAPRVKSADGSYLTTSGVLELGPLGCTGVLITDRALITAAHCVAPLSENGDRNFWYDGTS